MGTGILKAGSMSSTYNIRQKSLDELLVQMGVVSKEEAQLAAERAAEEDGNVAAVLVAERLISEESLAEAVCGRLSLPFIRIAQCHIDPKSLQLLPYEFQSANHFIIVDHFEGIVVVATCGVLSSEVVTEIEERTGCQAQVFVATVEDVRLALGQAAELKDKTASQAPVAPSTAKPQAPDEKTLAEEAVAAEESEAISQEAEDLLADLQRDLERFAPTDAQRGVPDEGA